MNYSDVVEMVGLFMVVWSTGFAGGYGVKQFKNFLREI